MVPDKYKIRKIHARELLDSRGNPTIEVDVHTKYWRGREIAPSGASKGRHEAWELRDGGRRYLGQGVQKAVRNVNKIIAPKLIGKDVRDLELIDQTMIGLDGTPNKCRLGANAILGVSLASCHAASLALGKHYYEYFSQYRFGKQYVLPIPFMNLINGGLHADNNLNFQEHMIVPFGKTYSESIRMASETYHVLKDFIHKKYGMGQSNVGDEGGFCPSLKQYHEPFDLLLKSIDQLGYSKQIKLAMDCAASSFYKKGYYHFDGKKKTTEQMMEIYEKLIQDYPIVSIEDPFHEEDFTSFAEFNKRYGRKIRVVGDDLTVTNTCRVEQAIEHQSCNTLLLKVNQVGTVTEAIRAAQLAHRNDWKVMISHRSGETGDHFIADFAVGLSTGMIKDGAPCRGERIAKHNQLLRIEEVLGKKARYAGRALHL